MNMLVSELQRLSADPWSWAVVALMAVLAGVSVLNYVRCPYVCGRAVIADEDVARFRAAPFRPGARLAVAMLLGAALTLAGLFLIAGGIEPGLALAALMAGILLIKTEPARLRIREHKMRVIACRDAGAAVLDAERARLRASHFELAAVNLLLLAALVAGLLAF